MGFYNIKNKPSMNKIIGNSLYTIWMKGCRRKNCACRENCSHRKAHIKSYFCTLKGCGHECKEINFEQVNKN